MRKIGIWQHMPAQQFWEERQVNVNLKSSTSHKKTLQYI